MTPIEQVLADYLPTVNDVFDLRHVANEGQIQPIADICYELLEGVDWLAVANAVAVKNVPVYHGEQISLVDSFIGYSGAPESTSDNVEPVVFTSDPDQNTFSVYDIVIDENTPIEMIERILESGKLMLKYEPYGSYCGSKMYREPNGEYTAFAFDAMGEGYRRTNTEIDEAWYWFLIDSKNIRVVDCHETEAGMFESVDRDELTYNEIGALLERGALHVDATDDWLAKTLYRVGDGEYAMVFECQDGTLRIDSEDDRCTLKHAVKEFKVVIEDRDVYLIPAG